MGENDKTATNDDATVDPVERNTSMRRILSALAQGDKDVSEVVSAIADEEDDDIREVALALVHGDKGNTVSPTDFAQVVPVAAYRGKIDRLAPGTGETQLLEHLAGQEIILGELVRASKEAINLSDADFLLSRRDSRGVVHLRLSDTDILQLGVIQTGVLHLRRRDIEVLRVKLSDTDILQLRRDTGVLQVTVNDGVVLRLRLSDTDILQLSLSDTDILQLKLSDTDILQLSDTDILQLSDTDILQLSDTDILQLSHVDVLHLRRRERFVSSALRILDESGFWTSAQAVPDDERPVVALLSTFAGPGRDRDLLALLNAVAGFLPSLELVVQSDEVRALERLASQKPKTLLALARLASERSDTLKALIDLVFRNNSNGGPGTEGIASLAQAGQPSTGLVGGADPAH